MTNFFALRKLKGFALCLCFLCLGVFFFFKTFSGLTLEKNSCRKIRSWIDDQNSKLAEKVKEANERVVAAKHKVA